MVPVMTARGLALAVMLPASTVLAGAGPGVGGSGRPVADGADLAAVLGSTPILYTRRPPDRDGTTPFSPALGLVQRLFQGVPRESKF